MKYIKLFRRYEFWAVLMGALIALSVVSYIPGCLHVSDHVHPLSDLYTEQPDVEFADGYRPGRVTYLFIHCTATTTAWSKDRLLRFFKNERGWSKPGYHYHVQRDGTIDTLVHINDDDIIEWGEVAYGAAGYNSRAIHVAWGGGIDRNGRAVDNRSDAQRVSLRRIVDVHRHRYRGIKVEGHRAVARKACPSFDAGAEYNAIADSISYDMLYDPIH